MKLEEQELKNIYNIQETHDYNIALLGDIEYNISLLETKKREVFATLEENKEKENMLSKVLEAKYGKINVNLETGEYTKIETE